MYLLHNVTSLHRDQELNNKVLPVLYESFLLLLFVFCFKVLFINVLLVLVLLYYFGKSIRAIGDIEGDIQDRYQYRIFNVTPDI